MELPLLSSREAAIAVWTAVFFAWALSNRAIRRSFASVVAAAFAPKLLLTWISLLVYAVTVVCLLERIGYWNIGLVKETLVWLAFTGVAIPIQFGGVERKRGVAAAIFRDSVSALILVEFFVSAYPFSLLVELILVPVVTMIVILGAVAEQKDEYKPVAKLMGWLQVGLGLAIVLHAIRGAFTDPDLRELEALREILLPVFLSVAMIPYVWLLRVYVAYDSLLWRIGWKANASRFLRHYGAARIMWHVGMRPAEAQEFVRRNALAIFDVAGRSDIEAILHSDSISTDVVDT